MAKKTDPDVPTTVTVKYGKNDKGAETTTVIYRGSVVDTDAAHLQDRMSTPHAVKEILAGHKDAADIAFTVVKAQNKLLTESKKPKT